MRIFMGPLKAYDATRLAQQACRWTDYDHCETVCIDLLKHNMYNNTEVMHQAGSE